MNRRLTASVLAALSFAILVSSPALSFAQESGVQGQVYNPISGPVFVDAFWTDRTTAPPVGTSLDKVEVGPGEGPSILAVIVTNRGLSDITSISGALSLPPGFKASGTNQATAYASQSGIVKAGDSFTLFFQVDVTDSAKVGAYTGSLGIDYSRVVETGSPRHANIDVPFRVTGKIVLSASSSDQLSPGTSSPVTINLSNIGSTNASAVIATLGAGGPTNLSSMVAGVGVSTFNIGTIPVGSSVQIKPLIYASNNAADTLQVGSLQVSYRDAYGIKQLQTLTFGLIVLPKAVQSEVTITPETGSNSSNVITAGQIYDYKFKVTNNSDKPLSDLLVTLASPSDTLKILKDSKWSITTLDAGASQEFATQVFAPTTMIGIPVTFNLSVKYLSGGQSRTESVSVGSYVDGQINVTAYDVGVSYIGGIPNVIGNLLNEGNTQALFTTIELTNADGLVTTLPPQQYLGDLDQNSPLPFSIPIQVSKGATSGTNYPVSLKVTYKDSLRQSHTFETTQSANFVAETNSTQSSQGLAGPIGQSAPMIGIIAIVIVAIIAGIVIARRRKRSALKKRFESRKEGNIESVLDSHRPEKRTEDRK